MAKQGRKTDGLSIKTHGGRRELTPAACPSSSLRAPRHSPYGNERMVCLEQEQLPSVAPGATIK